MKRGWVDRVWGRNLTNNLVSVLTQYNQSVAGTMTSVYLSPRTYGVRASARF